MAYRLHPHEPARAGLVRIAQEQLRAAENDLLNGVDDDPVQAIHSARKAVKKERALLRLARSATPASFRRGENRALRDAARRLSESRDAEVMVQALDDLHDRYAGQVPVAEFAAFRAHLEQERSLARAQLDPRLAGSVADELAASRERIAGWPLKVGGWKAIGPGLRRSYAQGREAFARARERRDDDSLHEWRKRAKDLWYHLRLLAPTSGAAVAGQAKEAHVLADLLGDDHDLAVLRGALTSRASRLATDFDTLLGLIDHRRAQLQTAAIFVGDQLYAESSKAFSRRLQRRWRAGRAQAQREQAESPGEPAEATRRAATA